MKNFKQKLTNLPDKFLNQPRWIKCGCPTAKNEWDYKAPVDKGWSKPEKQHRAADVTLGENQVLGFDISGHGTRDEILMFDFDKIFDSDGNFISSDAEKWFNYIHSEIDGYAEYSLSGRGAHIPAVINAADFLNLKIKGEYIYKFKDAPADVDAKLEIYVCNKSKNFIFTGRLLDCTPKAPFFDDSDAVKVFIEQIIPSMEKAGTKPNEQKRTQKNTSTADEFNNPTRDSINRLSIADLAKIIPDTVKFVDGKEHEFICPYCGNGSGDNKTGVSIHGLPNDPHKFYCFKCRNVFTNIDLFALHFKSDLRGQNFYDVLNKSVALIKSVLPDAQIDEMPPSYNTPANNDLPPEGLTDAQTIAWIKSKLDWEKSKSGKMRVSRTQRNLDLIFDHDPTIKNLIGYDEFYKQEVFLKAPLWKKNCVGDEWKNSDDAHLRGYLKKVYADYRDTESVADNIVIYSRKNSFHPVKQYLESLKWDGTPRAETYFSKFLNVDDTPYTREITRKWLLGAISRVYHEGCDFQFALVLHGRQGIGKGYSLRMLGQKWHVSLTDSLDDTHALDTIERGWIIEIAELAAGRKAEINAQKAFLSDNADTRRKAYARRAETTPRHCVFAISVNDEHFLRDLTGNRRYKILESHSAQNEIVEGLTAEYVDQVWAEAFQMYQELFKDGFNDQLLRLSREVDAQADAIAEKHIQDDGLQGEIESFLEKPVLPTCIWERLTKEERRKFFADGRINLDYSDIEARIKTQIKQAARRDETLKEFSDYVSYHVDDHPDTGAIYTEEKHVGKDIEIVTYFYGTCDRDSTCAAEIFNECFGNDKRKNTNRINEVLATLSGWKRVDKRSKNF
ncbi:MAG: hypothetical protein IJU91_04580, partial [Selenomonadaceae bacterium]|nr:hypothetical protein [Selenomonadaceae bacterium]